jgi:hypothetical protein
MHAWKTHIPWLLLIITNVVRSGLLLMTSCAVLPPSQFAPSYSEYVLYTDGGPADNVKRKQFRGQSASPGGKKKHMNGGLEIGGSKPPSRQGHRPDSQPNAKAFEHTR